MDKIRQVHDDMERNRGAGKLIVRVAWLYGMAAPLLSVHPHAGARLQRA